MSAEQVVSDVLKNVPKAVACGIVDMGTGMLIEVKTTDSHPSSVLDLVAAGTKEMFEGEMVQEIEDHFRKARGERSSDPYFQEIIVNSKNLIHVFSRTTLNPAIVVVAVCRRSANLGLVVMKSREIAENAEI